MKWIKCEWGDEPFGDWPEYYRLIRDEITLGWVAPDDYGRGWKPYDGDGNPISFPPSDLEVTKHWLEERMR